MNYLPCIVRQGKFGRPVMFMYEADHHNYTVKTDRDLKLCWDSVEEAHKGTERRGTTLKRFNTFYLKA